ncbi:substrate-binding domain-containing protein [Streptomyces sp. WAC 00631]|uniref:LacI family DNA-binding transcriptional regulator n=1 Tax=unclassified Streptomyces TaxID=2593676 RepID=UPI001E3C72C5|nr:MULTISPECIES: substrate-binding domain-containing protein [unclassified Streptomyces]MCC5036547.1 substrate-binding domain-containing protein [Streptomyces sp. WAC 00631]MCC9738308.1 substrate-binding domain-containing protein [Streptomyces sp. MNU89]
MTEGPAGEPLPHMDAAGRATLRTVAELAGVHVSTASRVLNGTVGTGMRTAGQETSERIRRIAEQVGYTPNPHASSLRTQRSNLVGVLVPRLVDIVLATVYEGIEQECAASGFSAFVANTGDDPVARRQRTEMVLARHVDGIIFGDAHLDGRFLDKVVERGVPFVLVSRRADSHPSVTCDDYRGGQLAAEHLLQLGHRKVAVIAGEPYASTGVDRTAGFRDTYTAAGIKVPASRIVHSRFDTGGGREAMERLLAGRTRPTAVFAVNDFAAIGAMGASRDAGLQVGTDIAVIGFNDVPLAGSLPVGLSTIRSPMHDMGVRAVRLLMKRLAGEEVDSERLSPALVARASTLGGGSSG